VTPTTPPPATPASPAPAAPTILEGLAAAAAAHPQRAATILPDGRGGRGAAGYRATTFAQLAERSDVVAAGLAEHGIAGGVRTALLVPPGADFFALVFGLLKAGAVPVIVDPGIGPANLRGCLARAAPEAFIGIPRAHAARRALRWAPTARRLVTVGPRVPRVPGGGPTLDAVERDGRRARHSPDHAAPRPQAPDQPAAVLFTSGSTGPPAGVVYRHPHVAAQLASLRALFDLGPGDVSVSTFPLFALFGPPLGMTTVIPRMDMTRPSAVDPEQVFEAVSAFDATVMFGSPGLLRTVGRAAAARGVRLPTLRLVQSAGAPVSRDVLRSTLDLLGPDARVVTPYGATEALPVASIGSDELGTLPGVGVCVGRPAPGVSVDVIRIDDGPIAVWDDGLCVAPGEVGELVVRGPVVTERYLDDPRADARSKIDRDGEVVHRMGDLGRIDADGRIWFCGRKVHRVATADGTLFTVPCEAVFDAEPGVARTALVGVGEHGAQQPVLCVELEPGVVASQGLMRALLDRGAADPATADIHTILYHPGFPVDVRHNAKVGYGELAAYAAERV